MKLKDTARELVLVNIINRSRRWRDTSIRGNTCEVNSKLHMLALSCIKSRYFKGSTLEREATRHLTMARGQSDSLADWFHEYTSYIIVFNHSFDTQVLEEID